MSPLILCVPPTLPLIWQALCPCVKVSVRLLVREAVVGDFQLLPSQVARKGNFSDAQTTQSCLQLSKQTSICAAPCCPHLQWKKYMRWNDSRSHRNWVLSISKRTLRLLVLNNVWGCIDVSVIDFTRTPNSSHFMIQRLRVDGEAVVDTVVTISRKSTADWKNWTWNQPTI